MQGGLFGTDYITSTIPMRPTTVPAAGGQGKQFTVINEPLQTWQSTAAPLAANANLGSFSSLKSLGDGKHASSSRNSSPPHGKPSSVSPPSRANVASVSRTSSAHHNSSDSLLQRNSALALDRSHPSAAGVVHDPTVPAADAIAPLKAAPTATGDFLFVQPARFPSRDQQLPTWDS